MQSPDMALAELIRGVRLQPLPTWSLATCEAHLAGLLDDAPSMVPPSLVSAPPLAVSPPPLVNLQFETAPPIDLPLAPSVAPGRLAPPGVAPPRPPAEGPPRLIIVSDPPSDAMFRLSDLEDEAPSSVGAAISEIIAPLNPPPLPSDSISDAIEAVALRVQGGDAVIDLDDPAYEQIHPEIIEIIDLDDSSIEVVYLDTERASHA